MRLSGLAGIACAGLMALLNVTIITTSSVSIAHAQQTVQKTDVPPGAPPVQQVRAPAPPPAGGAVVAASVNSAGAENAIRELIVTNWEKSTDNSNASRTFMTEQTQWANNHDVQLSYVVNRMRHNRYNEALPVVRQLHQNYPASIDAGLLRIWLETVTDNYDSCLVAIRSLRTALDDPAIDESTRETVARRCGRIFGFMQGPESARVDPDALEGILRNFADGLPANELEIFNLQRERVLSQYEDLVKTTEESLADEIEKVAAADEQKTQSLSVEAGQLENRSSQLMPQLDSMRTEARNKIELERSQLSPLQQQISGLSSRINAVNQSIGFLSTDILYLQQNSPGHPNLFWMTNQLNTLRFDRGNLINNANAIENQMYAINQRMQQIENSYSIRINQLGGELSDIEKAMKKNRKEMGKLADGPKLSTGKKSRRRRIKSLTTYHPFPLELYRADLVGRLLN